MISLICLTVRIEIRCELALEVVDAIRIIASKDEDIYPVEQISGPSSVTIHLSKKGHNPLVGGGLVAVDSALDIDAQLSQVLGAALVLIREVEEGE